MERDYSHIQGSDYAYVPQKPQQPNLIQGLFEAFEGFKAAKKAKKLEDEAEADKEKQKLRGDLKFERDEEDRQLNRKKLQGDIDLTEAKKLGLGKPKTSGKSGEALTRARKIVGGMLAHERGLDEMDLEKYKASPTYQAELDSYFSALHQAKEAGENLDASEMKHYENLSESFFKRNGGAPVASADSTGASREVASPTTTPQNETLTAQPPVTPPAPATTEPQEPNPFSSLPTLKNYKEKQKSKLLGPTPFEQYQGTMQNEAQEPNFENGPTQGPLRDKNIKVAPPLETKGGYGIIAGKAEDAVVSGTKGLANMAKDAIGSDAVQSVAGGLEEAVSALAETGRSIASVAGGNSPESTAWTKSNEDLDAGIKNVLDYPKENREQLKQIRDNEQFYADRLTSEGMARLNEAYVEAGLDKRPTSDSNKQYPAKMEGKSLLETLKGMNLEGMFDKKDNVNGQIFGTPQVNFAQSKEPSRKTGRDILMGDKPLRR